MTITLIAAMDKQRAIGNKNQLLCSLPNDMKHFKRMTEGKICIQGRKTYESIIKKIGQPLPKRQNIILTNNKFYKPKSQHNIFIYNSMEHILKEYNNYNKIGDGMDIAVIGGQKVYSSFLPYADRLELTIIDYEFKHVDTFFPSIDLIDWKITKNVFNKADENNPYDHYFVTYERKEFDMSIMSN